MTSEDIRKAIVSLIKTAGCNSVYFDLSPATIFPKIDCTLHQIEETQSRNRYSLTLDFYNESTLDSLENLVDEVIAALDYEIISIEKECIELFYDGTRYPVPQKDNNKIHHSVARFVVHEYKNKGGIVDNG